MTGGFVRVDRAGGIARLTLERPPLNVLHLAMLRELAGVLDGLAADAELKVLVVTGAGRAFCAGVDVADHTAERVYEMLPAFHGVIRKLLRFELPVVAAVNGAALGGGCELLLACDVVVAREDARLGQPEIRLAAFPPAAAVLMPRRIGLQRTLELVLTGRTVDAGEAQRLGLVHRVVPVAGFGEAVEALVGELAAQSRPALRLAKRAVLEGSAGNDDAALDHAEGLYLTELMGYRDPHEGVAAFLEKRAPVWRDA
ncbi:MAG: enoyl-CoA hydratase/isomerase family protein [Gemmatimonadetes bacterium]|nr:enoyl-CoA hydratase/isomerase family protein [Gemmatimonadota bacterium]